MITGDVLLVVARSCGGEDGKGLPVSEVLAGLITGKIR